VGLFNPVACVVVAPGLDDRAARMISPLRV